MLRTIAAASVPTPAAWTLTVFADTDNKLKQKDSSGVVTDLTATWWGGGWGLTEQQVLARLWFNF